MKNAVFILLLLFCAIAVLAKGKDSPQYEDSLYNPINISPVDIRIIKPVQERTSQDFPRFRLVLGGGFSYRIAPIFEGATHEQAEYLRGLKSGFNVGGEAVYFITELIGVGAKYSLSQSSSSGEFYVPETHLSMKLSETVAVQYFGPQFALRFLNKSQKNAFLMSYSLGYVRYSNEVRQGMFPRKLVGSSFGLSIAYGYELGLSDNVALGAQVSALLASISSYTETLATGQSTTITLPDDQKEGLSRIDFTIYLRFRKI